MDNTEYYKSLISDEEVIQALIKESKAREEGELLKEKTRVRPNLNFFQRTVTNLVSSNKRITSKPRSKQEDVVIKKQRKSVGKIKTPHTLMREILTANKVDFVKSDKQGPKDLKDNLKNYIEKKQDKIRELKERQMYYKTKTTGKNQSVNLDKNKSCDDASTSISKDSSLDSKQSRRSSQSSEISIVSISSSESQCSNDNAIIKLSDSESDYSDHKEAVTNRNNNKIKLKKKRKR